MLRRNFIAAGLGVASASALPIVAQATSRPAVVMLFNFLCPRSRAINERSAAFEQAAAATGVLFRYGPITWADQSLWPDRFYYAARDIYPETEHFVRAVLFDGLQRDGLRFEDLAQVVAYFEQRNAVKAIKARVPTFNMNIVVDRAASDAVLLSEYKATLLLDQTNATEIPVFVWVSDGKVKKTISPTDAAEPQKLAQLVLSQLQSGNVK